MTILFSPPAKVGYGGQVCVNCAIIIEGYNTKGHKGSQRKFIDI